MGRLLDLARQAADERTALPVTKVEAVRNRVRPSDADVSDVLPDPAAEARRQRVLAMLAERPGIRYAVVTDTEADPDAVILALAIRDAMPDGSTVTGELAIPRAKYDPFLLLELIERHGGSVH